MKAKLPLKSFQSRKGLTLYLDNSVEEIDSLKFLKQSLVTKWERNPRLYGTTPGTKSYWSECINIRIEERIGALWLILTPTIFIENKNYDWDSPLYLKQEEFRKKRLGGRYNKQFDHLFDGWCKFLGLDRKIAGKHEITLKTFGSNVDNNPKLKISTISCFSRGAV